MGVPLRQQITVASYLLKQKLKGVKRYPLVLMLEPLFRCNLACAGCGKIDYPDEILNRRLSVDECLAAVDECGAPIVSIAGGEPLLHKELPQVIEGIVARKKYVYLCTNALLLKKRMDDYQPSPYLTLSIHLDGNRERHDASVSRQAYLTGRRMSSSWRLAKVSASPSTAPFSRANRRKKSPNFLITSRHWVWKA